MKHVEEYNIELNLIKKTEVEDDELSDDEISDKFVPDEGREETKIVEVSKSNDDKKTTVVEADDWNDDDWIHATVVDEWTSGNEKQWEQSGNSVVIIDD